LQTNATYGHRMIFWRPTRGGESPRGPLVFRMREDSIMAKLSLFRSLRDGSWSSVKSNRYEARKGWVLQPSLACMIYL